MGTKKTTAKKKTVKRKRVEKTTRKTAAKKKAAAKPISPAQEGVRLTWLLLGELKSTQIKFLRVGKLLCEVRDRKLYVDMKHPDMEHYAEDELRLGRASYYRYVQVYDWVLAFHKEWLEPKPKGFIPELTDVFDLIWIEQELTRKDLEPKMKAALEALRQKALDGRLRKGELDKVRQKKHGTEEGLKSILSKVRNIRMRGSQLATMPAEAITHLDAAIEIIKNAAALAP